MTRIAAIISAVVALAACGGGGATDAGIDAASPLDLAVVDAPTIDAPGCADADGDGHRDVACGGDDCDDHDASRYPGNVEVCDVTGRDDDCDPSTLGPDADGDGAVYEGCCNRQPSGVILCGGDCDDTRATVGPTAVEVCNGVDDDCDGLVDEGVSTTVCLDADGDGYGGLASAMRACRVGVGETTICNDCDDAHAAIHPGQVEACQGIDDDCNGVVDDGCACTTGAMQPCGSAVGACVLGTQRCMGGVWPSECTDAILPTAEVCDGVDNDCDGMVDEGLTYAFLTDCDGDGYGDDATVTMRCSAPRTSPSACAHGVWTTTGGDCDDRDAARFPMHGCTVADGGAPDSGSSAGDAIVALAPAGTFVCARRASGSVICWGNDSAGQLGRGFVTFDVTLAGPVTMLGDAIGIAAATDHACAPRATGAVVCWGNDDPTSGTGATISSLAPVDTGLSGIVEVAAGSSHTCVRDSGGAVHCFGHGGSDQLGSGMPSSPSVAAPAAAVSVVGLADSTQLSARSDFTCARRATGAVVCWGDGSLGQLGDGSSVASATPVTVTGLSDAVEVAAGHDHACARRVDGTVRCWGSDARSELGAGPGGTGPSPVDVIGLADAVQITTGWAHACALRATGAVVCWGAGDDGQLCNGATGDVAVPTMIPGVTDAVEVAAGDFVTCVRHRDGSVGCCGRNDWTQPGDGTTSPSAVLTPVVLP